MNESWPGPAGWPQTEKPERKPWAVTPPRLVISASVFGALFAYLLTEHGLGLNLAIVTLLVYAFAYLNRRSFVVRTFRQEWPIYLMSAPVILLSVLFFTTDTALNILSVLVIVLALAVQYIVISGNAAYNWDQPGFILDMFFGALNRGLLAMGLYSAGLFGGLFKHSSQKRRGIWLGLIAGVILLLVIVPLLATSDANVSGILLLFFSGIDLGNVFLYLFMFYLGASLVMAPVASAKSVELTGRRQARASFGQRPVQAVTTGIALTMLGIVYVLFAAVQFQYFFMPYATLNNVLGLTSSQYAVRGFGELLTVTCINFAVILAAQRFTAQKDGKTPAYEKALFTLLVAFNFVIMASSHLRMQCYEMSYGYSVLRFLSHSFMVLLMILNSIILVRIYWPGVKTARLFLAMLLLYFCTITAINPERWVAENNITRYETAAGKGEEAQIDMDYLVWLSDSAIPSVSDFLERHPEMMTDELRTQIEARLDSLEEDQQDWQSLNTAGLQAKNRLEDLLQAQ